MPGSTPISPPGQARTTAGTTSVTDVGLSGVIGGSRTLVVTATAIGGGSPEVRAGVIPGAQVLDYSSTVLANGLVTLRYDANGVGLGADLSLGDGIQFTVVADVSSLPYDVTVTISDGTITNSSTQTVPISGLQSLQFLYTAFPTVNLASVFSIEVTFDPNLAGDLEVAAPIETFGEPFCGNGVIELVEECDDGNLFAGDGCEPDCTLSSACTFTPRRLADRALRRRLRRPHLRHHPGRGERVGGGRHRLHLPRHLRRVGDRRSGSHHPFDRRRRGHHRAEPGDRLRRAPQRRPHRGPDHRGRRRRHPGQQHLRPRPEQLLAARPRLEPRPSSTTSSATAPSASAGSARSTA